MLLINIFLQVHGEKERIPETIRTDEEGSLAESTTAFQQTIASHGYTFRRLQETHHHKMDWQNAPIKHFCL
jgi:hypothetical protein